MRRVAVACLASAVLVSGCATKRYGRLQPLTGVEQVAYTCRDIEIEIAKVTSFQEQVAQGAQFNMASVLGFLGDYGIGNSMERGAAERSAIQRLRQLHDLRASKGCAGTYLSASDRSAAAASVVNTSSAHLSEDPSDTPGTIQLSPRVKLVPAGTLSGYCIKAAPSYVGTGSASSPVATKARPMCS